MQVTTEDGGRLNAFAKEPRMEIIDATSSRDLGSQLILVCGGIFVVALISLSVVIS